MSPRREDRPVRQPRLHLGSGDVEPCSSIMVHPDAHHRPPDQGHFEVTSRDLDFGQFWQGSPKKQGLITVVIRCGYSLVASDKSSPAR